MSSEKYLKFLFPLLPLYEWVTFMSTLADFILVFLTLLPLYERATRGFRRSNLAEMFINFSFNFVSFRCRRSFRISLSIVRLLLETVDSRMERRLTSESEKKKTKLQ